MNKRNLLTLLVLVGSTSSASVAQGWGGFWHGFHIGVGAGTAIAHHAAGNLSDTTGGQNFKVDMNKFFPAATIILGYAVKVNNWHLGGEIDYLFSNLDTSFHYNLRGSPERYAQLKSKDAFGAAVRLGYHCDRVLGFVRLGLETRHFKMRANAFGAAPLVARNTIDEGFRKTAFAPGVGLQFMMNKNTSATLEYRCSWYEKVSKTLTSRDTPTTFSIRPRISTILLSLRYHI